VSKKKKFTEGLLNNSKILNELKIESGQSVVDAGCGNGYMARKFSELVGNTGKVYALDLDIEFIQDFQSEVENNTNVTAFVGDITKTTILKDKSIDLVYLSAVFHIFSKIQIDGFIKEVNRVLKSNGKLAIVNINKEETPFGPPLEIRVSPEELIRKITFSPIKFVKVGKHFYMQMFEKI